MDEIVLFKLAMTAQSASSLSAERTAPHRCRTQSQTWRNDPNWTYGMDQDSAWWIATLDGAGSERDAALDRLHEILLRVATHEAYRRGPAFRIGGQELSDLAHQAADDAMIALLGKLHTFRGESRFTTWAYRFVALEVSSKLGRHYWRRPAVSLDSEDWERLPDRLGSDPLAQTQQRELVAAVQRAMNEALTDHQRRFFVAIVLNGAPMDAMVAQSGLKRGAIYKAVFDARRKIRAHLTANGYLDGDPTTTRPSNRQAEVKERGRVVELVRTIPGHQPA